MLCGRVGLHLHRGVARSKPPSLQQLPSL
uniref:Uncharacterized protein n=1 Tax=Arundo donax TaxID=35708 RepID=A0A0A9C180_ARUDO